MSLLDSLIEKKYIFHFAIYILLVFLIPFFYKVIWLLKEIGNIYVTPALIFDYLFPSITVLIADVLQVLFLLKINKLFVFPIKNIIIIFIYNKLLLPVSGLLLLITGNVTFSMINLLFMLIFTLLMFNCLEYITKALRLLANILIFSMIIISYYFVYQVFF